jgi:DNA (cytosine-5)-methyltransferase 1
MRTHIDLFSGIGGFALAARWAGIKTVQFVEIDKFCQKVLQKNFPGVPIHDDIKTFTYANWRGRITTIPTSGSIERNIRESESKSDRWKKENFSYDHPFLLTGGFPCQPFSCAGKRRGKEDDRYLWEEMLRVIKEFKPTWIIGENVNGIRSMEFQDGVSDLEGDTVIQEDGNGDYTNVLDGICDSLEAIGYEVQPIIIPACAVNAPHRRDRVWIVANRRCEHGERAEVNGELNRPLPCEKNAPLLKRPNSDDGKGINSYTSGAGYSGTTWEGSARKEGQPDGHPTECVCDAPDSTQREDDGRDGRIVDAPEECGECGDTSAIIGDQFTTDSCEQCDAPDSSSQRLQGREEAGNLGINREESRNELPGRCACWQEPWPEVAQRFCQLDDGLSSGLVRPARNRNRVQKLKALGNSIVPQVAYQIMKAIMEIENA